MALSPPAAARQVRRRALTCASAAATVLVLVGAGLPSPEALGVGDRLFPELGNPGYEVRAYDISFDYSGVNTRALQARTVIDAVVTSPAGLKSFNLDFASGKVKSLSVNGRTARYRSVKEDLVVTPARPAKRGDRLRVDVRHTSPTGDPGKGGWLRTKDGLAMANQADAAHRVFPANDHPSDKAAFTFHVTAPNALSVTAGGRPAGKSRKGARTVWTYRMAHPMATELAQVSIGRSHVRHTKGPHGLPLRDVLPRSDRAALEPWLAKTPGQVKWMEKRVGRYPFETYGLLMADAETGFELETQTLSLFEKRLFTVPAVPDWYKESIMVHELAHQWFGDSVTPEQWDDLWLNEGNATWYEWLYGAERGGPSLVSRVREAYRTSDTWRTEFGPPARLHPARPGNKIDIFRKSVYDGSAVVLYALREKIGAAAFDRLQREWVSRFRDDNASTDDYIALVNRISGKDLTRFMKDWLYGTKTPPMPGRPGWRSK
ncbi:M1 family metallopeptidase [Streptomyces albidus (ex Kaewkla and Franco 2022)]|uniref:M1 family metallopeptidase n=1 Tax=Streptomyces albidus (ex Kaewkla and Franco 2022) TaxID=722709 RepID=UPI0015EEEA82|nr:M1 family metallopeptidase [Streptomyces albidus (ex Kaewkla and Franco 2022)]